MLIVKYYILFILFQSVIISFLLYRRATLAGVINNEEGNRLPMTVYGYFP